MDTERQPQRARPSSWGNTIRDHVVNTFTNVAARNSAIPAPVAGMTCYLITLNVFEVYNGAVGVNVPGLNVPVLGNLTASSGAVSGVAPAIPGLSAGVNVSAAAHQIKLTVALLVAQTGGPSLIRLQILDGAGRSRHLPERRRQRFRGHHVRLGRDRRGRRPHLPGDDEHRRRHGDRSTTSGIAPSWLLAEDMGA